MRTLNFAAAGEPQPFKRAGMFCAAVLVHVLALVMLANFDRVHYAGIRDQRGPVARFFVDVSLPRLAPRSEPAPQAAPAASQASAIATLRMAANPPPGPVEVLLAPRELPDPVRLQLAPASVARAAPADVAAVSAAATVAAAAPSPAPAVAAAAPPAVALQPGARDDTPKVIIIESIGSSVATYSFPALTGDGGGARPQVFKVEIGNYEHIEVAIVNHVIEQIRARYPDEITWDSKYRGGMVRLSMRPEDHAKLVKFLRVELFGIKSSTTY